MADGERFVRIEQQRDVRVAVTRDPARAPGVTARPGRTPGQTAWFRAVGRSVGRGMPATVSVRGSDGALPHGEPA